MGKRSGIEWTDATWNPIVGCSIVSAGCANCYAMRQANRIRHMSGPESHYFGTTETIKGKAIWTGKIAQASERVLTAPLGWRKPRRVFVNSMGDLFHESIPDEWIDRVFAVMALSPQHTFQVLTKRAKRMREYMNGDWSARAYQAIDGQQNGSQAQGWLAASKPLPNVHLGVSAERQPEADERIPDLLATPAAVRFVSAEPLLGPINIGAAQNLANRPNRLDWVIVGGESGPGARPMDLAWARSIVSQCRVAEVPCFVKQIGAFPIDNARAPSFNPKLKLHNRRGGDPTEWPADLRVREWPA